MSRSCGYRRCGAMVFNVRTSKEPWFSIIIFVGCGIKSLWVLDLQPNMVEETNKPSTVEEMVELIW